MCDASPFLSSKVYRHYANVSARSPFISLAAFKGGNGATTLPSSQRRQKGHPALGLKTETSKFRIYLKLVGRGEFKAPKGVIKVELEQAEGKVARIKISGDFFLYPEEALERLEAALVGKPLEHGALLKVLEEFFEREVKDAPMLEPDHFVTAILRAAS
jgi:hypothetical protein